MADRTLKVEIIGDASSLNRAFGKAADSGDRLGNSFKTLAKVGAVAGIALGGALAIGAKKSIDAASDLNESMNAVNVTFGKSAKIITDFGKDAAQRTGLSMRELNESVVPIGASLQNMGISSKTAAEASVNLAKRAADMASVFNTDVGTALQAIQSGLRGEADPLERFGVGLSAARVEAFALTSGLAKTKDQITDQVKVQARLGLLMQDSAKFAGDFANTSDGLANSQRILKAELENAGAAIGTALLPVATKVVGVLADLTPKAVEVGTTIAQTVGPALTSLVGTFQEALPTIMGLFGPLVDQFKTTVIPIFQSLQEVGREAITAIGSVIQANGPQIRQIFENLGTVISNLAKIILPILEVALTQVLPAALRILIPVLVLTTTVMAKVSEIARQVAQVLTSVLATAIAALTPVVNAVATAFNSVWPRVSATVRTAAAAIMPIIQGIVNIVKGMVDLVVGVLTGDWARAWGGIKTIVSTAVNGVIAYLQTVPALVLSAARAIGQAIVDGILAGIGNLGSLLKDKMTGAIQGAMDGVKGFLRIGSPSQETADQIGVPMGEGVIQGWITSSRELPTKMGEKIRDAIEHARSAIIASKGVLESAMAELADAMMSAFDRVTQDHMTKSESELLRRQRELAKKQREQALADANTAVSEAQAQLSAATTPEEMQAATEALKAAQQQRADALYDIETARLERQAEQERAAYERKRERQRVALENELAAAQAAYERGAISLEQYNQRVMNIMKKYEIPWKKSAAALGAQLAAGLHGAFADVQAAARALANTIVKELSNIKVIVQVNLSEGKGNKTVEKRQHGGPVRAGTPYLIGEVGPELFIPKASGTVIPNGFSSRGVDGFGGGTVVQLVFNGPTVGTSREFEDTVRRALYDVQKRNPGTGLATA